MQKKCNPDRDKLIYGTRAPMGDYKNLNVIDAVIRKHHEDNIDNGKRINGFIPDVLSPL